MLALKLAPAANPAMATVFYVTSRVLVVVLLGGCVAAMLANVLRGSVVSADRIFAAIVAYLLAGLAFAAGYQGIVELAPESFALPAAPGDAGEPSRLEVQLIYFGFVTIATLGYGDITPQPVPEPATAAAARQTAEGDEPPSQRPPLSRVGARPGWPAEAPPRPGPRGPLDLHDV